ncbi:MAG: cytochrome-c peroxidase [Kofleriaceae bacterium]
MLALLLFGASCVDPAPDDLELVDLETTTAALTLPPSPGQIHAGRQLFEQALPGSNGRSCATCHSLARHTALNVEDVATRLATNPGDPLFHRLDADDPDAPSLTFDHLAKGLVRVTLKLHPRVDVIDVDGNVITPADRTISVWRGVPSIENTGGFGPFQLDGREATLPSQAQSAIIAHSEGPTLPAAKLDQIAAFERASFSSARARFVATLLELGVPREHIPLPERMMALTPAQRRGLEVFDLACAGCHGGPTTNQITNRVVHDALFFELNPDGTIIYDVAPGQPPQPRLKPRPHNEFLNIGFGMISTFGQLGILPLFNDSVALPRYRLRFYADETRTQQVTDLPPIPRPDSGDPLDLNPGLDERGAPIVGPGLANQWFSADPGRAAVTGDPADFETFDIPQLRGIANTAPYFHDNSAETLVDVVDNYSRFILPFPPLGLPPIHEGEIPGFAESLTIQQKHDLVEFLQML